MKCSWVQLQPTIQKSTLFLFKSPGQRAALSGFVCYLRDFHGIEIQLPKKDVNKTKRNRQKKIEAEMLALMKAGKASFDNRDWLSLSLAYFHGLPTKVGKTVQMEAIDHNVDGVTIAWNGLSFWMIKQEEV